MNGPPPVYMTPKNKSTLEVDIVYLLQVLTYFIFYIIYYIVSLDLGFNKLQEDYNKTIFITWAADRVYSYELFTLT